MEQPFSFCMREPHENIADITGSFAVIYIFTTDKTYKDKAIRRAVLLCELVEEWLLFVELLNSARVRPIFVLVIMLCIVFGYKYNICYTFICERGRLRPNNKQTKWWSSLPMPKKMSHT